MAGWFQGNIHLFVEDAEEGVPEGHPQTRSHLAQFDTVGFRAIFA